jgi:hypothetical protein
MTPHTSAQSGIVKMVTHLTFFPSLGSAGAEGGVPLTTSPASDWLCCLVVLVVQTEVIGRISPSPFAVGPVAKASCQNPPGPE